MRVRGFGLGGSHRVSSPRRLAAYLVSVGCGAGWVDRRSVWVFVPRHVGRPGWRVDWIPSERHHKQLSVPWARRKAGGDTRV